MRNSLVGSLRDSVAPQAVFWQNSTHDLVGLELIWRQNARVRIYPLWR